MATNKSDQSVGDVEPKAKRPKLETVGNTSSQKSGAAAEPFLSLPSHILAKIIVNIPVAQWHALELLDEHFRDATMIAWRQLRQINVERDFKMSKFEHANDRSTFDKSIESILRKLAERSPLLTSLSGINVPSLHSDAISSLAGFEHLQSITVGDAEKFVSYHQKMPFEAVTEFLESTRSRTSLKELRLVDIDYVSRNRATIIGNRFASSLANGQEIRSPLKLEKFVLSSSEFNSPNIRLDNLDATRLTELVVGKASIEPQQLIGLIERASNLHRIELSFLDCGDDDCGGPRLEVNKKLLAALASHENLTAIKFDCLDSICNDDTKCVNFGQDFIEMLKAIGRRGRLRKLAMEEYFVPTSILGMDEICATIRDHIPYLQSIKIDTVGMSEERVRDVVSLTELEEINFATFFDFSANIIGKIVQLPHLKRLAIDSDVDSEPTSYERLAYATNLTHLRIGPAHLISADTFEKWAAAEGDFASKLEILMLGPIAKKRVNDNGLVQFLEKAVRLRVLVLLGRISSRPLAAIAKSCPLLEVLSVNPYQEKLTVRRLQEIVDRCPKLKRFGGMGGEMRDKVSFPKYRQIGDVDKWSTGRDFDDDMYEG